MKNPNFLQLSFLSRNKPNLKLYKYIDAQNFIYIFLEHLKEVFREKEIPFKILQPLLDPTFQEDKETVFSLSGVEVGSLNLLYNSNFGESSLIYFSPSGLLEVLLLNYEEFFHYTISDYVLVVSEFSSILQSQYDLYQ